MHQDSLWSIQCSKGTDFATLKVMENNKICKLLASVIARHILGRRSSHAICRTAALAAKSDPDHTF